MATNTGWWMYHGDPAHTGFVGSGSAINAAALSGGKFGILHTLNVGEKVRVALRPENIGIGKLNGGNQFAAKVVDRRYQGTQTIYQIDLFGRRLEVLELGTAARHQVGVDTSVCLSREGCWAYRDAGPTSYD